MMNPFLVNKEFELQVAEVHHNSMLNWKGSAAKITWENLVEVQKKVSVYKTGNNKQYTNYIFTLNRFARDIYLYMQCNLGEDQDTIKLDMEKICEVAGISKNSYYEGITDLKNNSIVSVYKTNTYWVNPFILFRGDRLAYYQEQCPECINKVVIVGAKNTIDEERIWEKVE